MNEQLSLDLGADFEDVKKHTKLSAKNIVGLGAVDTDGLEKLRALVLRTSQIQQEQAKDPMELVSALSWKLSVDNLINLALDPSDSTPAASTLTAIKTLGTMVGMNNIDNAMKRAKIDNLVSQTTAKADFSDFD